MRVSENDINWYNWYDQYVYEDTPFTGTSYGLNAKNLYMETDYVNGVATVERRWYPNGNIKSDEIQDPEDMLSGRPSGVSREWFPNGALKSISVEELGFVIEHTEWDVDGSIVQNYKIGTEELAKLESYREHNARIAQLPATQLLNSALLLSGWLPNRWRNSRWKWLRIRWHGFGWHDAAKLFLTHYGGLRIHKRHWHWHTDAWHFPKPPYPTMLESLMEKTCLVPVAAWRLPWERHRFFIMMGHSGYVVAFDNAVDIGDARERPVWGPWPTALEAMALLTAESCESQPSKLPHVSDQDMKETIDRLNRGRAFMVPRW